MWPRIWSGFRPLRGGGFRERRQRADLFGGVLGRLRHSSMDVEVSSLSQPCAVSCRRAIHPQVGSRSTLFGVSTEHMAPADAVCPGSQAVVDGFPVGHAGLAALREWFVRIAAAGCRFLLRTVEAIARVPVGRSSSEQRP